MFVRVLKRHKHTGEDRKGAAMVEMAVVLPVFFMILMGIVEFGRGMMVTQVVTNCAREAARTAILEGSLNSDVSTYVADYLDRSLSLSAADIDTLIVVFDADGNQKANNDITLARRLDLIQVHVSVPYEKVNFLPVRWLDGAMIRGQSVMRREH
jgi:Flp pilus assembly protein TadG